MSTSATGISPWVSTSFDLNFWRIMIKKKLFIRNVIATTILSFLFIACGSPEKENVSNERQNNEPIDQSLVNADEKIQRVVGTDDRIAVEDFLIQSKYTDQGTYDKHSNSGISQSDIQQFKGPVGMLLEDGTPFCTGTLISNNLILIAGHCIDYVQDLNTIEFVFDHETSSPKITDGNADPDYTYILSSNNPIEFSFEVFLGPGGLPGRDFAIVEISNLPNSCTILNNETCRSAGERFGIAEMSIRLPVLQEIVATIQHPQSNPKLVDTGNVLDLIHMTSPLFSSRELDDWYFSTSVDTEGGASGSGILDKHGYLIGLNYANPVDITQATLGFSIRTMVQLSGRLKVRGDFTGNGTVDNNDSVFLAAYYQRTVIGGPITVESIETQAQIIDPNVQGHIIDVPSVENADFTGDNVVGIDDIIYLSAWIQANTNDKSAIEAQALSIYPDVTFPLVKLPGTVLIKNTNEDFNENGQIDNDDVIILAAYHQLKTIITEREPSVQEIGDQAQIITPKPQGETYEIKHSPTQKNNFNDVPGVDIDDVIILAAYYQLKVIQPEILPTKEKVADQANLISPKPNGDEYIVTSLPWTISISE